MKTLNFIVAFIVGLGLIGCTANTSPTAVPTTQATAVEQQVYQSAGGVLQVAETVTNDLIATGVLSGAKATLAKQAATQANTAYTAWGQAIGQPAAAQAQQVFLASLASVLASHSSSQSVPVVTIPATQPAN